jgi:hypothetical protein
MTAEESAEPERPPVPFGLVWAIKRSFVRYVERMPDGEGFLADGAVPMAPDMVLFPAIEHARSGVDRDADHFWAFRGDVRFRGHAGLLSVRIGAPQLTVRSGRAELTIVDPFGPDESARLPLVTLQLERGPAPAGAAVWLGSDVRLTAAGAELFSGVYSAGEPFDQLSVVLPAAAGGDVEHLQEPTP